MAAKLEQWTSALKKKACKELTEIYNCYEPKRVKFIKNVIFLPTGQAKKIGFAHDYSFWAW